MTNPDIGAFIAIHMRGHPPARIDAMRDFLSTSAAGRPLADWHSALAAVLAIEGSEPSGSAMDNDVTLALHPADRDTEMRLVRSWMAVGTRVAGQVFFGA